MKKKVYRLIGITIIKISIGWNGEYNAAYDDKSSTGLKIP